MKNFIEYLGFNVEIHQQFVRVYGGSMMTVQHVRNWCREFDSCQTDNHDICQLSTSRMDVNVAGAVELIPDS